MFPSLTTAYLLRYRHLALIVAGSFYPRSGFFFGRAQDPNAGGSSVYRKQILVWV